MRRARPIPISRRAFLALGASVVAGACTSGRDAGSTVPTTGPPATGPLTTPTPPTEPAGTPAPVATTAAPPTTTTPLTANPFTLGVCAGDPDEQSAVLWTRLTGERRHALPDEIDVVWELGSDDTFRRIVATGTVPATAADGHSVHAVVELDGPAWYRFRAGGWTSPPGRVAPAAASSGRPLRMATASCQHFETGFYAAHRDIAEWGPDLVVFLGDFIYEYDPTPVGPGRVRSHDGPEPTDVEGYRARYAQYLGDPQLQASRAACPWLVIWDDHEVENNYAGTVPENPADAAGFAARRAAAYQAWWEHMPVRLPRPQADQAYPIHRVVRWGDLADLILLDGRQYRSDQACNDVVLDTGPACPEAADPSRTMLGPEQEQWLGEALAASSATWTVLSQQTVMTDIRLPNGAILNYDQWDGYAPARDRLLAQAAAADRVVVLTGDIHIGAVGRLPGVGVEFVTTSISSPSPLESLEAAEALVGLFPTVVDAELIHRGYTRHTVRPEAWTAEYRIVDDVTSRRSPVRTWRTFRVDAAARDAVEGGRGAADPAGGP